MKTIDDRLNEVALEIRRQVRTGEPQTAESVHRRLRRRRVRASISLVGVAALVVALAASMISVEPRTPLLGAESEDLFEAYETAYTEVANCLRDAGYQVEGPLQFGRDEGSGFALGFGGPYGYNPTVHLFINRIVIEGEDGAEADRIWEECEENADLRQIEQAWFKSVEARLLPIDVWMDNLLGCMADNGMEIPDYYDFERLLDNAWPLGPIVPDQRIEYIDPTHQWISDAAAVAIGDLGCTPWVANE